MVAEKLLGTIASALVVTPRVNLNEQWREEFDKWGVDHAKVTFECINTACKKTTSYDLLIVDECHKSLSPIFSRIYQNISYKYLVCLTATPPRDTEYRKSLYTKAPLVYHKTLNDSLDAGTISDFKVYNLAVPFSKEMQVKYNIFNRQFTEGMLGLSSLRRQSQYLYSTFPSAFDMAKYFSKGGKVPSEISSLADSLLRYSKLFWSGMSLRKNVLYSNKDKLPVVARVLEAYKDRKWIVFTKTIKLASEVHKLWPSARVYHSKLKSAEREQILEDYRKREFNVLIAVDALNEGFNVEDVEYGLTISGSSTELEQIQRLGRCLRLEEGKKVVFVNLYTPSTQEEKWVRTRTENLNPTWTSDLSRLNSSVQHWTRTSTQ